MSSGISGTFNAARIAAQELMETYAGRLVHIVDSLGCGFGNGLLAVRAAMLNLGGGIVPHGGRAQLLMDNSLDAASIADRAEALLRERGHE